MYCPPTAQRKLNDSILGKGNWDPFRNQTQPQKQLQIIKPAERKSAKIKLYIEKIPTPPPKQCKKTSSRENLLCHKRELGSLQELQTDVETHRRENQISESSVSYCGNPLESRALHIIENYLKLDSDSDNVVKLLLNRIVTVLDIVLRPFLSTEDIILESLTQHSIYDVSAEQRIRDAFEQSNLKVIVKAASTWQEPFYSNNEMIPTRDVSEIVLLTHGCGCESDLALRLYRSVGKFLVKAARKHKYELELTVGECQHRFDSKTLELKKLTAALTERSRSLGLLRTGMASEESKLGITQRQLGIISHLTTTTEAIGRDRLLPHEWSRDETFHLRSKYTVPKSANALLYATGDELLYTHKEVTIIAILQSTAVITTIGYDIDYMLTDVNHNMGKRVSTVLQRLAVSWGNLIDTLLPEGRLCPQTLETSFSVSHLTLRLSAVKFILSNMIRELKGEKPIEGNIVSLRTLDNFDVEEQERKQSLGYIIEQCRYYVSTYCYEILCIYNWIVAMQAITDIAVRITPEENKVNQITKDVNNLINETEREGSLLNQASLSLSSIVSLCSIDLSL